jgi:hypothetical protein
MMAWNRRQNIERRLEKLERVILPLEREHSRERERAIKTAAYKQMSEEDLWILRDVFKAGRTEPANEAEARALAAYRTALAGVRRAANSSKRK